ncbi:MAG: hypothetical protein RIQ60_3719 [Pseudomonadota bacterium]|jgi:hypothetical protein
MANGRIIIIPSSGVSPKSGISLYMGIFSKLFSKTPRQQETAFEVFLNRLSRNGNEADTLLRGIKSSGETKIAYAVCLGVFMHTALFISGSKKADTELDFLKQNTVPRQFNHDALAQEEIAFAFYYLLQDSFPMPASEKYWYEDHEDENGQQSTSLEHEYVKIIILAIHLADAICNEFIETRHHETFISNRVFGGYKELRRRKKNILDAYKTNIHKAWDPAWDGLDLGGLSKVFALDIHMASGSFDALEQGTKEIYKEWRKDPNLFG